MTIDPPGQCPEPVDPVQCCLYEGHSGPHSPDHEPTVTVPRAELQALLAATDTLDQVYWHLRANEPFMTTRDAARAVAVHLEGTQK